MHITDGVLPAEVLIPASVAGGALLIASLKSIQESDLAKVALFSALFFVAGFLHVPIGVTSAHLVLGGIVGLALGLGAFSAIFVALFLQALLFGFGGLSVLLVNTLVMGLPAYLCAIFVRPLLASKKLNWWGYFIAGGGSVLGSVSLLCALLYLASPSLAPACMAVFVAHLPLALAEGIISALGMGFYVRLTQHTALA